MNFCLNKEVVNIGFKWRNDEDEFVLSVFNGCYDVAHLKWGDRDSIARTYREDDYAWLKAKTLDAAKSEVVDMLKVHLENEILKYSLIVSSCDNCGYMGNDCDAKKLCNKYKLLK